MIQAANSRREAVTLLRLAVPLILANLSGIAIQFTDAIMVAQIGQLEFAAVGLAGHVGAVVFLFCSGFAQGLGVRTAQLCGASPDDDEGVCSIVWQGIWAVVCTSVPLSLALFAIETVFVVTDQPQDVASVAASYMHVFLFSIPLMVLFVALGGVATALERPSLVMAVSLSTIVVNFLGNYAFIYGSWGAPRLGVEGAALASIVSAAFQVCAMLGLYALDPRLARLRLWQSVCLPRVRKVAALLITGYPVGLILLVEVAFFSTTAFLAGRYGTDTLAAHQVAIQIVTLTLMIALGLGQAVTVRVGGAFGSANPAAARLVGVTGIVLISVLMGLMAAVIMAGSDIIVGLFLTPAERASQLAVRFLTVAALFQIADGMQTILAAALRGMNDTRIPLALASFSYWGIGLAVLAVLASSTDLKGEGIWIGMALALLGLAAGLLVRFAAVTKRARSSMRS